MSKQDDNTNNLTYAKWNCKYYIVFAPKYRREIFFDEKRVEIRKILKELCKWKGVDIIEGEICPYHVHLLLSILPNSAFRGYGISKGKE